MKRTYYFFLILVWCTLILYGCGTSIEEEKALAEEITEKIFNSEQEESNEELEHIAFYLPDNMEVKEAQPNNIVLEKRGHPYLLFYNQYEERNSEAIYESMIQVEDQTSIISKKTFSDGERFGYLVIIQIDENTYEVTTGIGGVKITTESKLDDIQEHAETSMTIVHSVKPVSQTNQENQNENE